MAEIVLDHVVKRYPDGALAVDDFNLDDRRRRVHHPGRPVRLREVDHAEHDRRAGGHHDRRPADRRRGRQRQGAQGPRHRDGVPVLRAVPAHDRRREHGLPADAGGRGQGHHQAEGRRGGARCWSSTQHLDRKPSNLSGGQRQRVAMGRAIVRSPKAFLMDEPLSNLDAKLRVQMRTQVARIQKTLGTTTVYVTHDQTEAMTLGDRVVVMRAGIDPAGRLADRALRPPDQPVRRRLHRQPVDELPAGHDRGRQSLSTSLGDLPDARRGPRGAALGQRRAATSSSASGPSTSRTPRSSPPTRPAHVRRCTIDLVESMGSDVYAYFTVRGRGRATPTSTTWPRTPART